MEFKILCHCGQKFAFDAEPENNRLPFPVACPACGADGTPAAHAIIAQQLTPIVIPPAAAPAAGAPRLRINIPAPTPSAAPPPPIAPIAPRLTAIPRIVPGSQPGEFNLAKGILGAFLGAGVGTVLLLVVSVMIGFKIPFFGVIVGALAGWCAKWLYQGTDFTLGVITAIIAVVFVTAAMFLMFGVFAVSGIISIVICGSVAWRIASG